MTAIRAFFSTYFNLTTGATVAGSFPQTAVANLTTDLAAKAANGANSDITSITGLTTPLAVSQGGTGAVTYTAGLVKTTGGTAALTTVAAPTGTVVGTSDSQTLTNKTLTTPTIGDFTNAVHTHSNSAGGGQIPTAGIADAAVTSAKLEAGKYGGKYLHIRDEKASGTAGGDFTSGAWRTRTLNTEVTDEIGSTLSSNEFTLPAGTYYIRASAPTLKVGPHKTRIFNVTDATTALVGTSAHAPTTDDTQTISIVAGRLTLASQKTLRLEHQCTTTRLTNGLGQASSFGEVEVYAVVEVWKVD